MGAVLVAANARALPARTRSVACPGLLPTIVMGGTHMTYARRVVVADDNREIADLLSELIASFGHEVRTCYDGLQARALIELDWPQMAVLDISMPELNGCDLARWIRAQAEGRTIRLVALTGHSGAEDCAEILAAGFDEILPKPFDIGRLQAVLEASAESGEQAI